MVRWIEVFSHRVQLHETPLSVAPIFAKQRAGAPRAWIFTSATLAVRGDFTHYAAQLGLNAQPLDDAGTARSTTRRRGCCTCRANLPQPNVAELHRRRGRRRAAGDRSVGRRRASCCARRCAR